MNDSNYTHTCQVCNEQYKPKLKKDGTPHKRKYNSCSSSCMDKARSIAGKRKRKPQVKRVRKCIVACCEANVASGGYCSRHYKQIRTFGEIDDRHEMFGTMNMAIGHCEICTNVFVGLRNVVANQRFCSWNCANIQQSINSGGDGTPSTKWRECLACGESFRRKRRAKDKALYCSRECGWTVAGDHLRQTKDQRAAALNFYNERAALRRISANVKRQLFNRTVKPEIDALRRIKRYILEATRVIGICECGCKFLRKRLDHKHGGSYDYCNQCREVRRLKATRKHRRTAKAVRRARMARAGVIERIDPIEVLDAFKWRCYICGISTPKKLRGTCDDRAPEVDHIVPLSKGGSHTFENLACACRACNAKKSDSIVYLL